MHKYACTHLHTLRNGQKHPPIHIHAHTYHILTPDTHSNTHTDTNTHP